MQHRNCLEHQLFEGIMVISVLHMTRYECDLKTEQSYGGVKLEGTTFKSHAVKYPPFQKALTNTFSPTLMLTARGIALSPILTSYILVRRLNEEKCPMEISKLWWFLDPQLIQNVADSGLINTR